MVESRIIKKDQAISEGEKQHIRPSLNPPAIWQQIHLEEVIHTALLQNIMKLTHVLDQL